jgi:hypothetical protein
MATDSDSTETLKPTWGRGLCAVVSVLIAWHVIAILMAPMSSPAALIPGKLNENVFRRYVELGFLNHAYKFFAPEPGPSHLVRYELEMPDGSRRSGTFPNLNDQWPRLLYHRYFMLSERLVEGPPDNDPAMMNVEWTRRPPTAFQSTMAKSYAEHLLHEYGARQVTLTLVEHLLSPPDHIKQGVPLNDPRWYLEKPLGTFVNQAPL